MAHIVKVGDLLINDVNDNNLYDSGVDTVGDVIGQPLSPQQQATKLAEVLKSLKVSSWRGLPLGQAGDYLNYLSQAEILAPYGAVEMTSQNLNLAIDSVQGTTIPFDTKRADAAYQTALTQAVDLNFAEAEKIAKEGGSIDEAKNYLSSAATYVAELQQSFHSKIFFDMRRADAAMIEAYQKGIPNIYMQALREAAKGNIDAAKSDLQAVQGHIAEANRQFNLGLNYDRGQGDFIMKLAYIIGIASYYPFAQSFASKGLTQSTRTTLLKIQTLIAEANQNYNLGLTYDQARADGIMEVALVKGIEDNFQYAARLAKKGDVANARHWLTQAENYTNEYNRKFGHLNGRTPLVFDQIRADLILDCALGKKSCP